MANNEQVIRDFIGAWSRLDPDELAAYFTDEGVYHNMPTAPVAGRAAVRGLIDGFLKSWSSTTWDIVNIVARGDLVIAERVDRSIVDGKAVNLPCCGVFEMEQGRIKVWRDYFDMQTYMSALRS